MTWHFERTNKLEHFRQAFTWHLAVPAFLRQLCGYDENDQDKFVSDLSAGLNWAGFEDGYFKALIHGESVNNDAVLGHLYNLRHSSCDFLAALIGYAKSQALRDYNKVVVELAVKHKGLETLVRRSGFQATGMYRASVYRGRFVENQTYVAAI